VMTSAAAIHAVTQDRSFTFVSPYKTPDGPSLNILTYLIGLQHAFALANSTIKPSQSALWPPNGKMAAVTLSVNAPDTCNVSCNVSKVTANDGATDGDWQITGAMSVNLHSDRSGKDKNGRTYTMQLACVDPVTSLAGT